jgi:hypothetical protein
MRWYLYVAYFFGGAFLMNAVPHLVNGVSGRPFPSPFATPPGEGMSPGWVNVVWGLANLFVGYLLLVRVGNFELRRWRHVLVAGLGVTLMALMLANHFSRVSGV